MFIVFMICFSVMIEELEIIRISTNTPTIINCTFNFKHKF